MKRNFKRGCALCVVVTLCLMVAPLSADTDSKMTRAREKYQIAVSDYLEAIASCNGALRKSAERQLNRVKDTCSGNKNFAHGNYVSQVQRLKQTYDELAQYFDEPSTAKMIMDQAINAAGLIPGVGSFAAAYSAVNTLYSYADEHIRSREGKDILRRAQKQFDQLKQYNDEYKQWDDFLQEASRRQYELGRQFDRNCAGRPTDEWRYEDLDPATAHQSGLGDVGFSGRDRASGTVFDAHVRNRTGHQLIVVFPNGMMILPYSAIFQRMIIPEGTRVTVKPGGSVSVPLEGFCLDPTASPPPVHLPDGGTFVSGVPPTYVPDENPFNRGFTSVPRIPGIVSRLRQNGTLPPTGLPPAMERMTIIQWSIWRNTGAFTPDDGRERIHEQVKKAGGTQTPEQIEQLNTSIWAGIDLVEKEIYAPSA